MAAACKHALCTPPDGSASAQPMSVHNEHIAQNTKIPTCEAWSKGADNVARHRWAKRAHQVTCSVCFVVAGAVQVSRHAASDVMCVAQTA